MTEYLAGRRILVVPDKFKGTTAQPAAEVIAAEARRAGARTRNVAMADGGERTVEAFGRANRSLEVSGPLGRPVRVGWRRASR
jgi:glycerate kinase